MQILSARKQILHGKPLRRQPGHSVTEIASMPITVFLATNRAASAAALSVVSSKRSHSDSLAALDMAKPPDGSHDAPTSSPTPAV
jgi:hypothetical protein